MKKVHIILKKELPKTKIPFVNHGGCGIFALNLHRMLNKLRIDNQIITLMYDEMEEGLNDYRNGMKHKIQACVHALVKVGKNYYDATGKLESIQYPGYQVKVNHREMRDMIDYASWNSTFDRRDVPKIKTSLNKVFTQLKKEIYATR